MKIKNVLYFINLLKESNNSFSASDLKSGVKLKQHIEKEKGIVSNNLEKTEDEADAIVKTAKTQKNKLNRKGRTPAQQIAVNVNDLEAQSREVYNLSLDYNILGAFSKLGINTQRAKSDAPNMETTAAVNKLENEIIRLIGANKSYWKTIETYINDGKKCTLGALMKHKKMSQFISKCANDLEDCWYDILNTRGGQTGRGEILFAMVLKDGRIDHLGSGDVACADGNIEIKCGKSNLNYDISSEDEKALDDRKKKYENMILSSEGTPEEKQELLKKVNASFEAIDGGRAEYFATKNIDCIVILKERQNDYDIIIVKKDEKPDGIFVDWPDLSNTGFGKTCTIYTSPTKKSWIENEIQKFSRRPH